MGTDSHYEVYMRIARERLFSGNRCETRIEGGDDGKDEEVNGVEFSRRWRRKIEPAVERIRFEAANEGKKSQDREEESLDG